MSEQKQRLRDPIHGLIVFDKGKKIDQLAWKLIDTPEFQRLRRIRQLGMSEFVFPGATHTRFAHSIGVFHNARKLMGVVEHEVGAAFDQNRANEILVAALLHDVGHGPFSHTFEGAREALAEKRKTGAVEKHEKYSAQIINSKDGQIYSILDKFSNGFAEKVSAVIGSDDPIDFYHAVVSSSFDADRLDFLVRDRYMTGTQAGSIDVQWLIDNLTTYDVLVSQDDDEARVISTFVFKDKGRQAAEDFLLARYRLYTQVYLHKTTRGFEKILSALLQIVGDFEVKVEDLNLTAENPLVRFLREEPTLSNYLALDDFIIWGAISAVARAAHPAAQKYALRLLNREHLHVLDISAKYADEQSVRNAIRRIEAHAADRLGIDIFKDEPTYNLYSRPEGEAEKVHKMVRVMDGGGVAKEITQFDDTIISNTLTKKKRLTRYYFLEIEDRNEAEKAMNGR